MPARLPSLLSSPPAPAGRLWLTGARLLDGTGTPVAEAAAVLVEDGRIARVGAASDAIPEGARVVDLGGRMLLPGLIDAHVHLKHEPRPPAAGAEPVWPGASKHFVAAGLCELLRMGFTTVRDVGSYGDDVVEARQAMRYGAFRGPRVLTCGRIVSPTAPGGRFFPGMYREADGPDDVRRAVREQLRRGADFIKIMSTGARSVELEDPDPPQVTPTEIAALVEEAHRLGYRVAAHAEGLAGTELAIEHDVDTIEHGMYLHRRPDLLERMAANGQFLVPTLSCFYGVAGRSDPASPQPAETWSPLLVELAEFNLEEADKTLKAARDIGVRIATGFDWMPLGANALEIVRMVRHGLSTSEALVASTSAAAAAAGLDAHVGTVEPGKLADLVVVDGDPLDDVEQLLDRKRIWLVLQLGEPVAGAALEGDV